MKYLIIFALFLLTQCRPTCEKFYYYSQKEEVRLISKDSNYKCPTIYGIKYVYADKFLIEYKDKFDDEHAEIVYTGCPEENKP